MNNSEQYMEALTKREWLAGQALAGMGATWGMQSEVIAEKAVKIADATLAELAKEKTHD